jgi:hypothetical protein
MDNLLKIPAKLLNYDACSKDICQVDGIDQCISPYSVTEIEEAFRQEYKEAKDFCSPLYSIGSKYNWEEQEDAEGVIFTEGGEKKVDFRWWRKTYRISKWADSYDVYKGVLSFGEYEQGKKEIRFEDELELLRIDERDSIVAKNYRFYINNYFENVVIEGTDKAKNGHLFFRAPRPNTEPTDGKLVRLTKAPRFMDGSRLDEFWSKPITLHSSAVTYVQEIELNCYESHQHKGTRLYLIGFVTKELSEKDKRFFCEGIPYVDVWESPELVVNKLKQAGWHLN